MSDTTRANPAPNDELARALRVYIVHLRKKRRISGRVVAQHCGMPQTTWSDWEQGRIADLRAASMLRAISFVGGSLHHLSYLLSHPDEEQARHLAEAAFQFTPQEHERMERIWATIPPEQFAEQIQRLRESSTTYADADMQLLQELSQALQGDTTDQFRNILQILLAGWQFVSPPKSDSS